MAHSLDSWQVEYSEYAAEDDVIRSLQDAICACSEKDVFTVSVQDIRTSAHTQMDLVLNLLPLMSQLQDAVSTDLLLEIFERFSSDHNQSRFSLMNAVTSVARDTRDAEQRWRLEELGGAIGAGLSPKPPSDCDSLHAPVHEVIPNGIGTLALRWYGPRSTACSDSHCLSPRAATRDLRSRAARPSAEVATRKTVVGLDVIDREA